MSLIDSVHTVPLCGLSPQGTWRGMGREPSQACDLGQQQPRVEERKIIPTEEPEGLSGL